MDNEHAKGAVDKIVGKTKEVAGHVTGNAKLETEGKVQQVKGAMHNAAGNAKDAAEDLVDRAKATTDRY
jgi:uncharacterized protein YjbJ (UPF0337 family)